MRVQIVFRVLVTESPLFKVSYDKNSGIMPVPVTQDHTSEKAIFSPSEIVKLRYFTVSSTSFGVTNML